MNKKYVPLLFITIVVLVVGIQFSKNNMTEQSEENSSNVLDNSDEISSSENVPDEQTEKFESNILNDYEKRAEAEAFILTIKGEALEEAFSSGTTMLYYDPESLFAYVDDELTSLYIERQLIYDVDPEKDIEETKELYQNHYYSVVLEYVAEYDSQQFSVVDGEEGRLRVKMEYMVIERDGQWEIFSNQYRGCTHVSDESND